MAEATGSSERILQSQLQLAHAMAVELMTPKPYAGHWPAPRKCRASLNVPVGRTPHRMVQHVECFHTELEYVAVPVAHGEVFVHRQIERLKCGCSQ